MKRNRTGYMLFMILLSVLFFTVLTCAATGVADDAELQEELPGQWIFTAYTEEQVAGEETPTADLAVLTLEENGEMSLLCRDKDGEYICSFGGTWSFELVAGGMDRLTLLFTSTDRPSEAGDDYHVECVFNVYAEGWVENDTQHTYVIIEDDSGNEAFPLAAVYGEDGETPVALHREQGPNMRVVNCKNYVSLREKRSTKSKRLAKVPLGALVLAYPEYGEENGFICCVYHDVYGYILSEHLEPAE